MNTTRMADKDQAGVADPYDLRPCLEFVANFSEKYRTAFESLFTSEPKVLPDSLRRIRFENVEKAGLLITQIQPDTIKGILPRLPPTIVACSRLSLVDYVYGDCVFVPDTENGEIVGVQQVAVRQFPRPGDKPSRILVGYSNGIKICPSAIPPCVFESACARLYYQIHVFLHELFHTVEHPLRTHTPGGKVYVRQDVILEDGVNGSLFSLEDWWSEWEVLYTEKRVLPPSRYAASYLPKLTREFMIRKPKEFERVLAEQICEAFVGYVLGIVPNEEGNPSFRDHSPEAWELFDRLAHSRTTD